MDVLMTKHKITRSSQAFDLLRVASQNTNRKLADVATEVGGTGTLDLPGQTADRRAASRRVREPETPAADDDLENHGQAAAAF
jgi:hypothetical protein